MFWLEEEFIKLEKIKEKDSDYYLKQFQVCNQIYSKIELLSKLISSFPIIQNLSNNEPNNSITNNINEINAMNTNGNVSSIFNSRNIITSSLTNEFPKVIKLQAKRGTNKKNKMFNCTICGERFPNGQALGND